MFFELEPNNPSIGLGASKDARCYTGAVFFGEEAKEFLEFCGGDLAEKGFVIESLDLLLCDLLFEETTKSFEEGSLGCICRDGSLLFGS